MSDVNDSIPDIGSQDVEIPKIPQPEKIVIPGAIAEELTHVSGDSLEKRESDKKRDAVLRLIGDVKNQREDIDKITGAIPQLIDKMNQISQTVDKQSEAINILIKGGGASGSPAAPGGMDLDKFEVIGNILEKAGEVYKSIKGSPAPVADEFTKTLLENSKNEALQNQNITSLINKKVKNRLINDVVQEVTGDNFIQDLPGVSEHGPL